MGGWGGCGVRGSGVGEEKDLGICHNFFWEGCDGVGPDLPVA